VTISEIMASLPSEWIDNFVAAFEAGRVQKHPQARFVNAAGECCLAAALVGARSSVEFMRMAGDGFHGSVLEAVSRGFESRRFTAQQVFEEALLAGAGIRERIHAGATDLVLVHLGS